MLIAPSVFTMIDTAYANGKLPAKIRNKTNIKIPFGQFEFQAWSQENISLKYIFNISMYKSNGQTSMSLF